MNLKNSTFIIGIILMIFPISVFGQEGDGHDPMMPLSYVPSGYTDLVFMRQDGSYTSSAKNTVNNRSSTCDLFVNFTFDTSGKNVFMVYTNDGSAPTTTNGTSVSCTLSNFTDPNRTWVGSVPPTAFIGNTFLKYVFYISDSDLASAWGRVAGSSGYTTSWTEGDDFYATTIYFTNSSAGGNWSNISAWMSNPIPNGFNNPVEITSSTNGITVDQDVSVQNLIVAIDGQLEIDVNKSLTVAGNFTNNASSSAMVISSDATGNGSLIIEGSATGEATVERFIAEFSSSADGWHQIGCPMTSMSVSGTTWDPTSTGIENDLYYWSEPDALWMNYRTQTFNFSTEKGYLVANDNELTHSFTGILNVADVQILEMTSTVGKGDGWHLLGNPFSSAIKWNDGNWSLNNVAGTAKIWDYLGNPGNYTDLAANDIIPSTNGFFVERNGAPNGSVIIPRNARTHSTTNNYKNTNNEKDVLHLRITNDANSMTDLNTIGFKENATNEMDMAFDSHKLFGNPLAPQLWTISDDEMFSTNYLPYAEILSIPLSFKAGVNTTYHLTVSGVDNFNTTSELYLEDLHAGTIINFKVQSTYDFTATVVDNASRFVLKFLNVTYVPLNKVTTKNVIVYVTGSTIVIMEKEGNALIGEVKIHDLYGQTTCKVKLNGTSVQTVDAMLNAGIYVVFIKMKDGNVHSEKIIINQ